MKLIGGFTPKEAAIDIATGWLNDAYKGKTEDLSHYAATDAQKRALMNAIATLHNRLLATSKMEWTALDNKITKE